MSFVQVTLRRPNDGDGYNLHRLVARCQPLDTNSVYCNLLQCTDFSDTSIAAENAQGQLVGFISGYRPPSRSDTLFVWQVAVDATMRGQGLALRMLLGLVERCAEQGVRYLETTISPDNGASQALFRKAFARLGIDCQTRVLFSRAAHFDGRHEDEVLYRAGPFAATARYQGADMNVFELNESSVRSYCRSFPVVFKQARGSELITRDGKHYIDFLAGAGTLNYGHNHPVLKQALLDYIAGDGLAHGLDMYSEAKERFLETFNRLILEPRGMGDYLMQFTGPTGSNAVEAALKLARKVTGRSNVISFTNGFHGCSIGSLAATGNQHHRGAAGISLSDISRMPYANYFGDKADTIGMIDKLLADPSSGIDKPAAVIVEVLQGEGGLNAASAEWMRKLEKLCRKHDMLLIVDDIQAGCGRTGSFFSFEGMGIQPDMITLSKSLSGFGVPFAMVVLRKELDQWQPGEHNGTFRGNNHAFVTAAAALEHFWRDDGFARSVLAKGQRIADGMARIVRRHGPGSLSVKGRGMMLGIRCPDGEIASAICRHAFDNGLVIETSGPHGEVVKCLCPLVISDEQIDQALGILDKAFAAVLSNLPAEKAS
ncbi:diaminobutyrate--2-oxoglutarate transaminase [Stutzerimonas kirkiae]|nr:diaminobutyrate--2-oxoglutarate transaminase [Stutzerimonas kirkiae]TBV15717.1 diaminobutyrate--2-oxoglutarate transaminase [Stutzerimonas kirkiae]